MPLCMYALRILGDTAEAEDAVQDAVAAAWQRASDDLEIGSLKAFLYTSVRNAALMRLRARRPFEPADVLEEVSDEEIDTSERDARLWKAMDSLPQGCRKVFLMSKRDGLSNAEIAEELDISVKTVENQMTKAYKALRGKLTGDIFVLYFFTVA